MSAKTWRDAYPDAVTQQELDERKRLEAAVADERRRLSDEALSRSIAQNRAARERQERQTADHAALLHPWEAEHERLLGTLAAAKGAPILRELREAQEQVAAAEASLDNHLAAKP